MQGVYSKWRSQWRKLVGLAVFTLVAIIIGVYICVTQLPELNLDELRTLLIYLGILIVLNSVPIKIGNNHITFSFALSFMAFLKYGLAVEILLVQVALVISVLFTLRGRKFDRIIFNQGMLLYMSVIPAFVYLAVGGEIGFTAGQMSSMLLPIGLYAISYLLVNNIIMTFSHLIITDKEHEVWGEEVLWDLLAFVISLSYGVVMYIANNTFGFHALLIISSQFILIALMVRFYAYYKQSNLRIKTVNRLVSGFTSELDLKHTIMALQSALQDLIKFDYNNIYIMQGDKLKVVFANYSQDSVEVDEFEDNNCLLDKKMMEQVLITKHPVIIDDPVQFFKQENLICKRRGKSFMSLPLVFRDELLGVINMASLAKESFSKRDIEILSLFANQAGLAIKNAATYKAVEDKSLLDELTGIYNYRAFLDILMRMLEEADYRKETIALLMLDIDFFKDINDVYGHQAGNQVLRELAQLLMQMTRKEDIVARYGGEEFTIIIPNGTEQLAYDVAERIRKKIENHTFALTEAFIRTNNVDIKLTVSIGIATYPTPAETINDLIRFSDRALYYGSKKQGRNKVSIYTGHEIDE